MFVLNPMCKIISNSTSSLTRIYLALLLILFGAHGSICQLTEFNQKELNTIKFQHLTSEQGLAHNRVHSAIMDDNGFMWFGTQDGLTRWDGYSAKNYYPKLGDSTSVSGSLVTSLAIDKKGFMWVVSHQGDICRYDPETDQFKTYHYPAFENDIVITAEMELFIDQENIIWIGTFDDGFIRFDPETKIFKQYNVEENLSKDDDRVKRNSVLVIEQDPTDRNILWLGTNNGLYHFNKISEKTIAHSPAGIVGGAPAIRGIYKDDSNTIWLATLGSGIGKYSLTTQEWNFHVPNQKMWEEFNFSVNNIHSLALKSASELWISSAEYGSGIFDIDTKEFYFFEADPTAPGSIKSKTSNLVYTDRHGSIWWMQGNHGISYMDPICQIFKYKNFQLPTSESSWNRFLSDFTSDKNSDLFYGVGHVRNGLFEINHHSGKVTRIPYEGFEGEISQYNSVLHTTNNELLVGGMSNLNASYDNFLYSPLLQLNKTDGKLKPYNIETFKTIQDKNINHLFEDSSNNIWVATDDGYLIEYNSSTKVFNKHKLNVKQGTGVNYIAEDTLRNQLFCASFDGIYSFSLDDYTLQIIEGTEEYSSRGISMSPDGNFLWIGTRQLGVQCYDIKENKLLPINEYRNAPRTPVEKVFIDKQNRLWATTERGIYLLIPKLKSFYNFGTNNGIPNDFFYSQGTHVLEDGTIILGQQGGYYYFHPDGLDKTLDSGPILITNLLVNQQEKLIELDDNGRINIKLPYDQNSVSIGFSSISYCQQDKVIFEHRMDGLESEWIVAINNERMIRYPALAPGKYTFMVKKIGSAEDHAETMNIHITPPIWRSWIAYFIYGSLFLYAINWVFSMRLKRQKEKEELRLKISSDIHDDVGSLLATLSMQSEIMSLKQKGDEKKALLDISNMGREAMEKLRDIVWALDSRRDKYENLIDKMKYFLHSKFSNSSMSYIFESDTIPDKQFIRPDVRQNIYLLFKEAVTNLIKHSNGTQSDISLEKQGKFLVLRIYDNGTNNDIEKSEGQGLVNMKMRAKRINGTLHIDQTNGFEVKLTVPI